MKFNQLKTLCVRATTITMATSTIVPQTAAGGRALVDQPRLGVT